MDWTEAETRLATLERDVTRRQRLARENRALARDGGRVAAAARDPWLGRWLGRWLSVAAEPAPAVGDLRAHAPRAA
jgi:hypothetical protein